MYITFLYIHHALEFFVEDFARQCRAHSSSELRHTHSLVWCVSQCRAAAESSAILIMDTKLDGATHITLPGVVRESVQRLQSHRRY